MPQFFQKIKSYMKILLQSYWESNLTTLDMLPMEILHQILEHLDLEDLKNISQTCDIFDKISWRQRSLLSRIRIRRLLTAEEIQVYKKSTKTFKNVKFESYCTLIIEQLNELPSIQVTNIILSDELWRTLEYRRLIREFEDTIKTITCWAVGSLDQIRASVSDYRSEFPVIPLYVKTYGCALTETNLNQFNADCFYPIQMHFENTENLVFHEDVYHVMNLHCEEPDENILRFRNIREMTLDTDDLQLIKNAIEINKNTLTTLQLTYIPNMDYRLPCQLKKISLSNKTMKKSFWIAEFLKDQRHLREVSLSNVFLTEILLNILSKNKALVSIDLIFCESFGLDADKMVFPNIKNVKLAYLLEIDNNLLNAIFRSGDNLTSLYIKCADALDELNLNFKGKTLSMKNLKTLFVAEPTISSFFYEHLDAPNLEVCFMMKNNLDFLMKCKKLKNLNTGCTLLESNQVKRLLKSSKSLRICGFTIEKNEFFKIIPGILRYSGSVRHFDIDIEVPSDELRDFDNRMDTLILHYGQNWRRLGQYFTCGELSFNVNIDETDL